jgi:hypothetical protein
LTPVVDAVSAARFRAQLLVGEPARSVLDVVRRILAVQAQDERGFRLAIRARTVGLTAVDVERALTEDRSVVVTWLNRRTLHLVSAEDYWWLHALTAPTQMTANARRLTQEGVSPADAERGVDVIVSALGDHGPLTRNQLRERLTSAGVPTDGQALVNVLLRASVLGHIVRGPVVDGGHAFVLVRDWLGPPPKLDPDSAGAELARRYLVGHGPATDRDLARWSGLALGAARRGLAAIASETVDVGHGMVDLVRRDGGALAGPPPRLLGPFEPVLLGWTSRASILGDVEPTLVTNNGIFRPFALVDGRAGAGWRIARGAIEIEPFVPMDDDVMTALRADADGVKRFLAL